MFFREMSQFSTCARQADVSAIDCDQTLGKSGQVLLDLRRNARVAVVQTHKYLWLILFDLGSLWEGNHWAIAMEHQHIDNLSELPELARMYK